MADRTKVLISYSHRDSKWLKRLQVYLKPLERAGNVERWDDTRIAPGTRWREEIRRAIDSARIAVLLVSADFLASDFVAREELPSWLAAARADGALILPVIVSPSLIEYTTLAQFQAVNLPERPLIALSWTEQEKILIRVTEIIKNALEFPSVEEEKSAGSVTDDRRPLRERSKTSPPRASTIGHTAFFRRKWRAMLGYGSIIALAVILLGLGLQFYALHQKALSHSDRESHSDPAPGGRSAGGIAAGRHIENSPPTISGPGGAAEGKPARD